MAGWVPMFGYLSKRPCPGGAGAFTSASCQHPGVLTPYRPVGLNRCRSQKVLDKAGDKECLAGGTSGVRSAFTLILRFPLPVNCHHGKLPSWLRHRFRFRMSCIAGPNKWPLKESGPSLKWCGGALNTSRKSTHPGAQRAGNGDYHHLMILGRSLRLRTNGPNSPTRIDS